MEDGCAGADGEHPSHRGATPRRVLQRELGAELWEKGVRGQADGDSCEKVDRSSADREQEGPFIEDEVAGASTGHIWGIRDNPGVCSLEESHGR